MPPTVQTIRLGPVLRITLNRPDKRNAVNPEMAQSLEASIDELENDPGIRVGILDAVIAAGRPVFCAGHDLHHFLQHFGTPEEHAVSTARGGFAGFVQRQRTKPVIAAVDGLATAGGFELVLACDLVIATTRAAFALPEARWNLIASGGGVFRAPRLLGSSVAADMMLTGSELDATRAHALGLVSRLVSPAELANETLSAASAVCRMAPRAVSLTREVLGRCAPLDEVQAWRLALAAEATLRSSHDLREGLQSFSERRPARWTGT